MHLSNKFKNNGIIIFILIVASVLRIIFPTKIPFTQDEFSALFRTEFNSFNDLIQSGVKPDGHPALIQVFLFYWVKIIGINELFIKLPFILSGIASVYLIYIIAKKWHNQTVALISAAFMASLQYPVMYSQIARPYISGLFFCLMMVWFWTNLVQKPQNQFFKKAFFYVLFSSLSAYNHHFSLLFAFIVGATGCFMIERKYLIKYLLLELIVFVLYIPHLGIFFNQLNTGSIEDWLNKPGPSFIPDYITYLFHFSYLVGILIFTLCCIGFYQIKTACNWNKKFFIVSLILFISPIIIGFVYSYTVGAVMQYSVLIFSFPFFLFILFSHIQPLNFQFNLIIVIGILSINSYSLVNERLHYRLFYQSLYEQIIIETENIQKEHGNNCISILSSSKKISEFYFKENNIQPNICWLDTFEKNTDLIDFLKIQKADFLSFGCLSNLDPIKWNLITEYFPFLNKKIDYNGGSFYLLSKIDLYSKNYLLMNAVNNFESTALGWEEPENEYITDSLSLSGKYSYFMDKSREYSPAYIGPLDYFIRNKNDFIDVSVYIHSPVNLSGAYIVSSIESNGRLIDWRSAIISYSRQNIPFAVWQKTFHSIKLSDVAIDGSKPVLKVFIWNSSHESFYIDDIIIKGRIGNPYLYGLIEPF